jgi:hypothetical protein
MKPVSDIVTVDYIVTDKINNSQIEIPKPIFYTQVQEVDIFRKPIPTVPVSQSIKEYIIGKFSQFNVKD